MAEVIIDDADQRIEYSDGWFTSGQPIDYGGTIHGTQNTEGVTATFTFAGSSVSVYGTISPKSLSPTSPTSKYSIDGSSPVIFNPSTPSSDTLYNHLFYQSPLLKDAQHTLVITCDTLNSSFWLDYIKFNLVTSTTSPVTLPSIVTETSIISTTTPTTSTISTSRSSKTQTGIIIGAVIGGIILLIVVFFLVWRCWRRTHVISDASYWNEPQKTTGIAPFNGSQASNIPTPNGHPANVQENRPTNKSTLPFGPGTTQGMTTLERRRLHDVQPFHSQLHSMSSSSTSSFYTPQDSGEGSSLYREINNPRSPPSYVSAPHVHDGDLPRTHGIGSRRRSEDTLPAYQDTSSAARG